MLIDEMVSYISYSSILRLVIPQSQEVTFPAIRRFRWDVRSPMMYTLKYLICQLYFSKAEIKKKKGLEDYNIGRFLLVEQARLYL